MKKLFVILLFLIVSVSFAYGQAVQPAVITMKLAHFAADDHPGT